MVKIKNSKKIWQNESIFKLRITFYFLYLASISSTKALNLPCHGDIAIEMPHEH